MARGSIRRRFLFGSIASTLLALVLFVVGSFAFLHIDNLDIMMDDGDSFRDEVYEMLFTSMAIVAPLALIAASVTAIALARRAAKPLEDAIQVARETTAHDLRRSLPVPTRDDELRDLVVSLNGLFVRLDDGFGVLGRFAADASHELRTPLAVMATELEVSLRHPRRVEEWESTARASLEELHRMSALVEGLLALARAGSDAPAARTKLRLVESVDAVISQLSASAEEAGVSLVGPANDAADQVDGNPVMIEMAIRNLVANAVAAVPRGGHVHVGLARRDGVVVVTVDDDGPGLGPDPESLFVPFHRGSAVSADSGVRGAGVGLGLAIARRVATAHGGTLVPNVSPNGGARFELTLPRTIA